MKKVTDEVVLAVASLRENGWKTKDLLNVSEFIDVFFKNSHVHYPGDDPDVIAEFLAENEENIIPYVTHVLNKGE